jgi:hypothetical protein
VDTKTRVEPTIWKTRGGSYQVRYRDSSGRQRTRSFERLTDARIFRAHARLLRPRRGHFDPAASRITFQAWAEAYLDQRVAIRPRTRDRYEGELPAYLLPCFGDRPLFAISRSDVQEFIVSLVGRGLAPATIKGAYSLLAAVMALAEEEAIVQRTPCRRISLPPVVIKERRYLCAQEVERPRLGDPASLPGPGTGRRLPRAPVARDRRSKTQVPPARARAPGESAGGVYHRALRRALSRRRSRQDQDGRRTLVMPEFLRAVLADHLERYPDPE